MRYPWLDSYLQSKNGAVKEYKLEWEAFRYMIGGKMFCMIGSDNQGRSIATLKLAPADGEILRRKYSDVYPGYYMNKEHWNSIDLNGSVPDDILRNMADSSYMLVLSSLPKKAQAGIAAGSSQN